MTGISSDLHAVVSRNGAIATLWNDTLSELIFGVLPLSRLAFSGLER